MKKEVEIRISLSDIEYNNIYNHLHNKINNMIMKNENDTYFVPNQYIQNTDKSPYILRIRNSNGKSLFTMKAFVDNKSSWIEEESEIINTTAIINIISYLKHEKFLEIKKKRYTCKIDNIEINLDKIENLGNFIELEIIHDDIKIAKNILKKFAIEEFNIHQLDIIDVGYVQLMNSKEDYQNK